MQPNEAPEWIWTDGLDYCSKPTDTIGRTGYVRADLLTVLEAEVARLREALNAARLTLAEHEPHPLPTLGMVLRALAQEEQP